MSQGESSGVYAFQGREWDVEIGLYYFRARYYDPHSGKWAGDDPIGLAGGLNFSRFVSNNPVRFIDPFGLCEDQSRVLIDIWTDKGKQTNEEKRLKAEQAVTILQVLMEIAIVLATLESGNPVPAAEALAIDANKLVHIFGNARHNLGPLVQKIGSQEGTFRAVQSAAQAAVRSQGLSGVFQTTVDVAGQNVVVRGNVIDGVA